ncbi:sugar ABC transporter permease [Arthrobacter sp. 260]|nr:sugar ABC transporter permease [Arthrobacter sp. 260]NOJ58902.1 sugar ABC transporter permease [Arthrobacter sp. 260]
MAKAEQRAGLTLISPTLIIVLVLIVIPILWTIMLSFQQIRLLNLRTAGVLGNYTVSNFAEVFSSPGFLEALIITLVYSVAGTGLAIGLGLVTALALRKPFRGRTFVRAATLIPYVAPIVAVTFVWTTMLNPQFGIINHWGTTFLGWEEAVPFLSERQREVSFLGITFTVPTALFTVIAFEAWRSFPFAFLFLTARLQAVPASLDEAARVDGATPTQRFRYILLPQLLPTIAVLSVLRFIWTFNSFDDIYLLTGGGAGTEVVAVRVYNFLISRGDIGAAAAQAVVLAAILAVLVGIYLKFFAKKEEVS